MDIKHVLPSREFISSTTPILTGVGSPEKMGSKLKEMKEIMRKRRWSFMLIRE